MDYAADATPVGVELLCIDEGVELKGLPQADVIARLIQPHGIKILV